MVEVFIERLRALPREQRQLLSGSTGTAVQPAATQSGAGAQCRRCFPLAARTAWRPRSTSASARMAVRFETAPELVCGARATVDGQKLAWSVADYLSTLAQDATASQRRTRQRRSEHRRMPTDSLLPDLDRAFEACDGRARRSCRSSTPREIGTITSVSTGIATVSGLAWGGIRGAHPVSRRTVRHRVQHGRGRNRRGAARGLRSPSGRRRSHPDGPGHGCGSRRGAPRAGHRPARPTAR